MRFFRDIKTGQPNPFRPNPHLTCQNRVGPGQLDIGKRVRKLNPSHFWMALRVGGLARRFFVFPVVHLFTFSLPYVFVGSPSFLLLDRLQPFFLHHILTSICTK